MYLQKLYRLVYPLFSIVEEYKYRRNIPTMNDFSIYRRTAKHEDRRVAD